jgi:hypothetical protein
MKNDWLKNNRKPSSDIMRAVGGKLYKPKYSNVKIHCSGAISRKSLIPQKFCKFCLECLENFEDIVTYSTELGY